jgi:hypothetical protein
MHYYALGYTLEATSAIPLHWNSVSVIVEAPMAVARGVGLEIDHRRRPAGETDMHYSTDYAA